MKKRRLLAWLMALVMMVGLMPATALAMTEPTLTPAPASNDDVTISKVAELVEGKDDEWQITMTIDPAKDIDPQPLELVLVLDTSGSMNFCTLVEHSGQHKSTYNCSTTMKGTSKNNWTESRLYKATEEAKNMLTTLETAKVDATISIVTFDDKGRANLTETKSYTDAKTTLTSIGNEITSGGTYVNDGLKEAYNILSDEPEGAVKAVVLLGDGVFNGIDPVNGNDGWLNDTPGYATAIKGTTSYGATGLKNATLYTIAFAAGPNANAALARVASPNEAYVAGDSAALQSVFAKIASKIVPMVSDNMTSTSASDVKVTGTPTVNGTEASNIVSNNGEVIRWNSDDTITQEETVTLTYNVTLKDLQSLNVGSNTVDLNGDAKLSYTVGTTNKSLDFPRPQAVVTVGQLVENYYLDGVKQDALTVTHDKVIVNGTNTFAWRADDTKITGDATYHESKDSSDNVVAKDGSQAATGVQYVVNHYYTTTPIYTVTYTDGVEGEEVFEDQVTSGLVEGAATPAFNGTPEREGYKFMGWTPDVAEIVTADVTYTAVWQLKATPIVPGDTVNYIVEHYKADAAGVYPSEPTAKEYLGGKIGAEVTAEPKTYEGYKVNYEAEGTVETGVLKAIKTQEDIVALKLYYDPVYNVTYFWTGDIPEGVELPTDSKDYTIGETVTAVTVDEVEHYKFDGWYYGDKLISSIEMPGEDVELTGVWTRVSVPVTPIEPLDGVRYIVEHYKGDAKTGEYPATATEMEVLDGTVGDTVTAEPKTYEGYKVNYEAEGTVETGVLKAIKTQEDIVVLKLYYDPVYNVTYSWTGDIPEGVVLPTDNTDYNIGDTVTAVTVDGVEGYRFDGWYKGDEKVTFFQMPAQDVELKGSWTPIDLEISFDANAWEMVVEGTMDDQTVQYGVEEELNKNQFTRTDGYVFTGWNTEKDGTGTAYADKAPITVTEDTILYAQWEMPETYKVYYNPNGGSGFKAPTSYNYDDTVTVEKNMFTAPTGMQFAGWALNDPEERPLVQPGTMFQIRENTDFYAVWEPIPVVGDLSVTYHANGGTGEDVTDPSNVAAGETVTVEDNMFTAPEGMKFVGWALNDPEERPLVQPGTMFSLDTDTDFYAVWAPLEINVDDSKKEIVSEQEFSDLDMWFTYPGLWVPQGDKIVISAEDLAEMADADVELKIAYKIIVKGDPGAKFRVVEDSIVTWIDSTVDVDYDTEPTEDRLIVSSAAGRLDENGEAVLYCIKSFDAADAEEDGAVVNTATIVNESDPDQPPFDVKEEVEIKTEGVSVTKTLVSDGPFEDGDEVTFLITVTNLGNEAVRGLVLEENPGRGYKDDGEWHFGNINLLDSFFDLFEEEPVVEEPVVEEPVAEEPVAEESVAEEPVAEEPVAEEPVAEEPAAEEPVAEEPVAEEPVAEEPAVEEPVVDVASEGIATLSNEDNVPFVGEEDGKVYIPYLADGETYEFTYTVTIKGGYDAEDYKNTVVLYDENGGKVDEATNDQVKVEEAKNASISIEKEIDKDDTRPRRGEWVEYTITVENDGEVTLYYVRVEEEPGDVFSEGKFTDYNSDADVEVEFDGDEAWIEQLEPGEVITFTYKAKVADDAERNADLENEVSVRAKTVDDDKVTDRASENEGSVYKKKSGGGGSSSKKDKEVVTDDVEEILNTEDHFQYVQGYPDGTVGPERNITRAEATVIFFRLLQDHVRAELLTAENNFPDVNLDDWFNLGVSTMEYGDFVSGYEDGYFRPNGKITRAELATIISNFDDLEPVTENRFPDVEGHWAEAYINSAAEKGWLSGYDDGLYRPNQYITRAETMSMINRVLNRRVDAEGLHKDAKQWVDNTEDKWYYYAVLEATNHHDYQRADVKDMENWTAINPNKIWEN